MISWEKKFDEKFDFMIPTEFDEVKAFIHILLEEQEKIFIDAVNEIENQILIKCADELEKISKTDMQGWEFIDNLIKKWRR